MTALGGDPNIGPSDTAPKAEIQVNASFRESSTVCRYPSETQRTRLARGAAARRNSPRSEPEQPPCNAGRSRNSRYGAAPSGRDDPPNSLPSHARFPGDGVEG